MKELTAAIVASVVKTQQTLPDRSFLINNIFSKLLTPNIAGLVKQSSPYTACMRF